MNSRHLRTLVIVCLVAVLAGCGSTASTRWALDAQNEDVDVEGGTYRVRWIASKNGEYDFQSFRNETLHFADHITQKRQTDAAIQQVARRLCSGQASVLTSTEEGNMFYARVHCG